MPTGFTTIAAADIQDAAGNKLVSGRVWFYPVNSSGRPVSFLAGGGPVISRSVGFIVVNGAITTGVGGGALQLADTTLTTPVNVGYRVTILDETGTEVQGPGYDCVQPSGSNWSLDTYPPGTLPLATGAAPATGGGTGGGTGSTNLIFASPNGAKWRLAISSGVEGLEAYSGAAAADPLYLLDQDDMTTIWQAVAGDDGLLSWTTATGVIAANSVAITDDDGTAHILTRADGVSSWT